MRSSLSLAAVCTALAAAACGGETTTGADTSPPSGPAVLADCVKPSVEPTSLTIACADANFVVDDLEWSSWGGDAAEATGTARVNDCKPDCGAGSFENYEASLTLSRLERCGGRELYTEAEIDFVGDAPGGFDNPAREQLVCDPGGEDG
jgi:hypothetical protein